MIRDSVLTAAEVFEAAGALSMVAGLLLALALALRDRGSGGRAVLRQFRHRLGRAIILGLEFLIAADILRTISGAPTLREVIVLGIVVLIRTFLSFTLEVELDGLWPWQKAPAYGDAGRRRSDVTAP